MKKKLLAALLAIALVAGLAGCGDKQDPQENTDISKEDETSVERVLLKDLDVESIVTLGEYKKLEWKPEAVTVTDADVDDVLQGRGAHDGEKQAAEVRLAQVAQGGKGFGAAGLHVMVVDILQGGLQGEGAAGLCIGPAG